MGKGKRDREFYTPNYAKAFYITLGLRMVYNIVYLSYTGSILYNMDMTGYMYTEDIYLIGVYLLVYAILVLMGKRKALREDSTITSELRKGHTSN